MTRAFPSGVKQGKKSSTVWRPPLEVGQDGYSTAELRWTRSLPSGDTAIEDTGPTCPGRGRRGWPVFTSQIEILTSLLKANVLPSGAKTNLGTMLPCGYGRRLTCLRSSKFQTINSSFPPTA